MARQVVVLGSTGSIGLSTLDVLRRHEGEYSCFGLSANTDIQGLFNQCKSFKPRYAVMADLSAAKELDVLLNADDLPTKLIASTQALEELAAHSEVDIVVSGIVGAAGLLPTLAAVQAGKTVLVANKEPLVMMGDEIVRQAKQYGAALLPVDSEHNAIFQCLPLNASAKDASCAELINKGVRKLLLTGSGGPFRGLPLEQFAQITPEKACAHPNWQMGKKISVDSATMMNKGLELIEACALFELPPDRIEIVVHPQSAIHSMVEYVDGSILAQMASPDMRVPIASALAWPARIDSGAEPLDLIKLARFDFEAPDFKRFPLLQLASDAAQSGGTVPTVLSAANEVAVDAFLAGRLAFTDISRVVDASLQVIEFSADRSLESVLAYDTKAREAATKSLHQLAA